MQESKEMLRWLLERALPDGQFACLYCGQHGKIDRDEYVRKHTCVLCDEFYEVGNGDGIRRFLLFYFELSTCL